MERKKEVLDKGFFLSPIKREKDHGEKRQQDKKELGEIGLKKYVPILICWDVDSISATTEPIQQKEENNTDENVQA